MKKLIALLLALLTCFAAALADTGSRPEIPQGTLNAEVMPFTPGQTYAVYSAPDSRSIRGAKGRARVSTNGWIQVFGAEGDWKTAAMVRVMKIMTQGKKDAKGTSFMEDYTYNLVPGKEGILEAHMLEVCPTIADGPISIKCQPLSMGDREDPTRLVFTAKEGPAVATSLVDLGDRFRLIINSVDCKKTEKPMPKLPVATAFWTPQPDLRTGAEAWILAGGAHHTAFSYDLTPEQMGDWAEEMGIEAVYIDKDTKIRDFKNELRWNEAAYRK